jgi:quinol monooxygenase YgiN
MTMAWVKMAAAAMVGASAVLELQGGGGAELVSHAVYFTLKEPTKENVEKFVASCRTHSSKAEGAIFFACGERGASAGALKDKDFHVSQTLIFQGREALEKYMKGDARQRFVAECRPLWSKVRVFEVNLRGMETPGLKRVEGNAK